MTPRSKRKSETSVNLDALNEHQLEELLSRKECKWIWDLGSTTPYAQNQDDGSYCQNKRYRNGPFQDIMTGDSHFFIYIATVFYYNTISILWGRLYLATCMSQNLQICILYSFLLYLLLLIYWQSKAGE